MDLRLKIEIKQINEIREIIKNRLKILGTMRTNKIKELEKIEINRIKENRNRIKKSRSKNNNRKNKR